MTDAPAKPVTPRPAASLLVLRRGPGKATGPEVLMGVRGAGHKFMPNRLVFPGGAVDAADHTATLATPPRPDVLRRLERSADPSLARAIPIAAARELEEETGLSLGSPPVLHGLDYLCRAVTPEASPVRFDARFLVVDAGHIGGTLAGSGELEDLRWWGIEAALAVDLATAQRRVLERLLLWMVMSEDERRAQTEVAVLFNRAWATE
ncbi:NUDIX hydrolase [Limobrevibacterium gyesilva]|uniref:NUDIX hydrolase n=1 Tax=Limobrevibacterium gyesilva TaxID=2991712 RepID=A0AA42CFD0_9PROT|nr:NUDIX hydrolase [Limobrevibacterium gyesilva]MCW3476449.1 NUDIX hydrolase [Limobrevibacterium gyesilva]